jgi:hypothetical protein
MRGYSGITDLTERAEVQRQCFHTLSVSAGSVDAVRIRGCSLLGLCNSRGLVAVFGFYGDRHYLQFQNLVPWAIIR